MDLIPIGQAAARLGMSASALRYYDERKLVCPSTRRAGQRMYGAEQLRRLAFIKIANRLGLSLQTSAAVLDAPSPQWRHTVRRQIAELDEVIAQAQTAQTFLSHALNCPSDHPARECATMIATLDRLVAGTPIDRIAAENLSGPDVRHDEPGLADRYPEGRSTQVRLDRDRFAGLPPPAKLSDRIGAAQD